MSEGQTFQRITVEDTSTGGKFFAIRDGNGVLTKTGWISPEGEQIPDREMLTDRERIDAGNPAAMVPWDQQWQ